MSAKVNRELIDILLNIYNKVNENGKDYLINNNSINWKSLRKIVEILSSIEENLFKEEYKIRKKWENSIKNKYNNNLLNQEEESELQRQKQSSESSKKPDDLSSYSKEELEQMLQDVLEAENYERAAEIRDEIDKRK